MNPLVEVGVAILSLALIAGVSYWRGYAREHEARLVEVAQIRADIAAERKRWDDDKEASERELKADAERQKATHHEELADANDAVQKAEQRQRDLTRRNDALAHDVERLRNQSTPGTAATQPADDSAAGSQPACTPDMLPEQHRIVLVDLASAANAAVRERNQCVDQFAEVKRRFDELKARIEQAR